MTVDRAIRSVHPMSRRRRLALVASAVLGLAVASCGSDGADTTAAASSGTTGIVTATSMVDIGGGLQGIAGLSATEYATGLLHVSALTTDADGRLWATTASLSADGTDGLYVITAADATPIEAVSTLSTPLGLLWVGDELFVSSASTVEAYSGFDGTTFASHRTVVAFDAEVGEVNGLAIGPDGRIVLGISAPCNACTPTDPVSASIVSFLPDGSDLQVYATDIRAAVGLAFYPGTDILFATMNQRDDLGDATPGDLLATVAEVQSWGFPDCYGQGGTYCTMQPTAVAELDRHAAVSGIAIATGQLGTTVGTAAIVAEWSTGNLVSVALDPSDPSAESSATALVTGIESPVAVVIGADGALYTGDWTIGTIYRITATDAAATA